MSSTLISIHCSVPSQEDGTKIIEQLLAHNLIACAHIGPKHSSHYVWEGAIETSDEYSLSIKTLQDFFPAVSSLIKQIHCYDVPEITAQIIDHVDPDYLHWVETVVNRSTLI